MYVYIYIYTYTQQHTPLSLDLQSPHFGTDPLLPG